MRHTVSPPLEPVALAECAIFSTGLNAILHLEDLVGPGLWTLLVPTEEAFADLSMDEMNDVLSNRLPLTELLLTHLVRGMVMSRHLAAEGWLETARGDHLPVDVFGEVVMIDGARVVQADQPIAIGIAHVIDRVLLSERRNTPR